MKNRNGREKLHSLSLLFLQFFFLNGKYGFHWLQSLQRSPMRLRSAKMHLPPFFSHHFCTHSLCRKPSQNFSCFSPHPSSLPNSLFSPIKISLSAPLISPLMKISPLLSPSPMQHKTAALQNFAIKLSNKSVCVCVCGHQSLIRKRGNGQSWGKNKEAKKWKVQSAAVQQLQKYQQQGEREVFGEETKIGRNLQY